MKTTTLFSKMMMALAAVMLLGSCAKKLDLYPDNDLTPEKVYSTPEGYKSVLAKIYGTLSVTGNAGPAGAPDIAGGLDEGSQVAFIRMFFNCQELPTEEAVVAWNDQTIKDFHYMRWTSADPFLKGIYARPIYNITLMNEYLRESGADKLSARGITGAAAEDIKNSAAEVRFLRAFNYWVMLDLFGKSTFITEADEVGTNLPREISKHDLYLYICRELDALLDENVSNGELTDARSAVYGRVDKGAAWALLARIKLNEITYMDLPDHRTEALDSAVLCAKKVIDAGYQLHNNYRELFMADNEKRTNEIIWAINCDGLRTQAYGNTTFFVHCAAGDDHDQFGVGGGWYGYRATKGLADKFTDLTGATDKRALFTTSSFGTSPSQIAISDIGNFSNGLHVNKYINIRSDGGAVSDVQRNFSDVDFPVFRLAEMFLIYAEATKLGGNGDAGLALQYINDLRTRAYGSSAGNITAGQLTTEFILDERARELYWEGHRRTDLIRYNLLTTGTYLWPWKGGVASGTDVDDKYNIFPIPAANRTANPNLTQNDGY
jgi:hypothetical protein